MSKKPFRDKNIKMVTPEMSSSASESFCPSHFLSLTFQFALFMCSPPNSSTSFCRQIIFLTPYFYSVPHTGRMFLVAHCPHTYIISPSLTENYVFNLFSKRFLVVDADFEAKSRRSRKVTFINQFFGHSLKCGSQVLICEVGFLPVFSTSSIRRRELLFYSDLLYDGKIKIIYTGDKIKLPNKIS